MKSMTVRDAMHKDVVSCDSSISVHEAARVMNEKKLHTLVVVDFDCALGGIITQSDIVSLMLLDPGGRSWDQVTVGEIMTSRVLTVTPDMSLREAAQVMRAHRIHQVAVAELDDMCTPIGILSMGDIMRYVESEGGDEALPEPAAVAAVAPTVAPTAEPAPARGAATRKSATKTKAKKPAGKSAPKKATKRPAKKK